MQRAGLSHVATVIMLVVPDLAGLGSLLEEQHNRLHPAPALWNVPAGQSSTVCTVHWHNRLLPKRIVNVFEGLFKHEFPSVDTGLNCSYVDIRPYYSRTTLKPRYT